MMSHLHYDCHVYIMIITFTLWLSRLRYDWSPKSCWNVIVW